MLQCSLSGPLLLLCLIAFVSCQLDYESITLGTTKTDSVNPCSYKFYSVDVTDTDEKSYLSVSVTSNQDNILVTLSNEPFTSTMLLNGGKPNKVFRQQSDDCNGCTTDITLDAICPFAGSTTWYITVEKVDDGSGEVASFSLSTNENTINVTELTMDTERSILPQAHSANDFSSSFDFYHFTNAATSIPIGQMLTISITNATNSIANIYFNGGSVPAYGYNGNTCYDARASGTTLVVDYCTWLSSVRSGESDFYISVQPTDAGAIAYDIEISTAAPEVVPIAVNQESSTVSSLVPSEIDYFSFDATSNGDQFINATITNVQGGTVEFIVAYNTLPFASCTGGSGCNQTLSNCCDSVSSTCELVVQPCQFSDGTFYLGIKPLTFESNTIPITYQVNVDMVEVPNPKTLKDSSFLSDAVSPSHYKFYEFSPEGNNDNESTLDIHLFVDQTADASAQTTLFVNGDAMAGSACWESIVQCTVSDVGSCSVQLTPCMYEQYDDWYVSVYGGDIEVANPTTYTVMAKLTPVTELDESNLIMSSYLQDGEMIHYQLEEDLLPEGGLVTFSIFDVSGGTLNVYQNYGDLAGPTNTCPLCFNNTMMASTTVGQTFTWDISNCDAYVEDNKDELFLSVEAVADLASVPVSFSMTVSSAGQDEPSDELRQDQVLISSVIGNSQKNYTIESDGSQAYLTVSLSLVDATGTNAMTLSLVNTTNLNCMGSAFSSQCTTDVDGYCFLVIQACQYNSSDGWIAVVENLNNEEVYFNLNYDITSSGPQSLSNGSPYSATLMQDVYKQFSYSAEGSDTLIVEVFFDSFCQNIDDDEGCPGSLYVSTEGPAGPNSVINSCFYNSVGQTDTAKVVYAVTGCDLPEEEYYFSVTTSATLLPNQPLAYTIRVTEMDSTVPVELNKPLSNSLYVGQRVYHTFTYNSDAASGSRIFVNFENIENGEVTGVLAQHAPPSTDTTCPCFEYSTELSVDYCDSVSGEWTVLVQASGAPANQLVNYVITVIEFSQAPIPLALGTEAVPAPLQGSVLQGRYQYYSVTGGNVDPNSQLVLSLSSIVGGEVSVYVSTTSPATASCMSGSICNSVSDICLAQIGSCVGSPSYLSVFGSNVETFDPVTYEIQIFESSPISLTSGVASPIQTLQANFVDYYTFTLDDGLSAPYVSMSVTNAQASNGGNAAYALSLYADSVCSSQVLPTLTCSTSSCDISYSACEMGTLYYLYVSNLEQTASISYTVTASYVDLLANTMEVDVDTPTSDSIVEGQWKTYQITLSEFPDQFSLSYTLSSSSGAMNSYFGFATATPDCNEHQSIGRTTDTYTVDVCCVQNGTYYLSVMAVDDADVTVEFTYNTVISSSTTLTNSGNSTVNVEVGSMAELSFQIPPYTNQPTSLWHYVEVTENGAPADVAIYIERISAAGPVNAQRCITNSFGETTSNIVQYTSLYCPGTAPSLGGSTMVGVENTGNALATYNVEILYGSNPLQPLTLTTPLQLPARSPGSYNSYFSLSTNMSASTQLTVRVESSVVLNAFLQTSCASAPVDSCATNAGSCELTFSPTSCSGSFDFVILVEEFADTQQPFNVSAVIDDVYPVYDMSMGTMNTVTGDVIGSIMIPAGDSQFGRLVVSNLTQTAGVSASYMSSTSEKGCFSPIPAFTCSLVAGEGKTCIATLDSCLLQEGSYEFLLDVSSNSATYNFMFEYSVQQSTEILVDSVLSGSVFQDQRNSYNLTIDYASLAPGSDIEITLSVTCGSASLYLNQGNTAGPDCFISSGNSIIISSCDLSGAPLSNYLDSHYSITVIGGAQTYGEDSLNLPSQYLLEVDVVGFPETFRAVGPNQVVAFNGENVNYVLPAVTGLENLAGQLEISLTLGTGNSATLGYAFNEPLYCTDPDNSLSLQVNKNTPTQSILIDACSTSGMEQLYFQFAAGSDATASFEIVHIKPFVRDLNEYPTIPQMGAVTPTQDGGVIDEEYYKIDVDATGVENFQFAAWIESTADSSLLQGATLTLMTSQSEIPVRCNANDGNIMSAGRGVKIVYDWCQFADAELFMTVDAPSPTSGASSIGYSLYYSTTLDIETTTLSENVPLCDMAESGQTNYYSVPAVYSPNQTFGIRIYSISGGGANAISGNVAFGGLATNSCTDPQNQMVCASGTSCEWLFSCPFPTNGSLAITNSGSSAVDYFVVWESTQVLSTPLVIDQPSTPSLETSEYYSISLPTMDTSTQFFELSVTSVDGSSVTMWYNEGALPSTSCNVDTCTGDSGRCSLLLNSCTYTANTKIYILASSASPFTVTASIQDVTVRDIMLQSYEEMSLMVSTEEPFVLSAFKLSITDDMIANSSSGSLFVSVYGVNQDTPLSMYISSFGAENCVLAARAVGSAAFGSSTTLTVPACSFAAGDYYISAMLSLTDLVHPCSPVTFGVFASMTLSSIPVTPLTSGTVVTVPAVNGEISMFSYAASGDVSTIQISSSDTSVMNSLTSNIVASAYGSAPGTFAGECSSGLSLPTSSLFGCTAVTGTLHMEVIPSTTGFFFEDSSYSVMASSMTLANLTNTLTDQSFTLGYQEMKFHQFYVESDSLQINLIVSQGPSVEVTVWDNTCENAVNVPLVSITCFFGTCAIPFSWSTSDLGNTDMPYIVSVQGYAPASYSIGLAAGAEETCYEPESTELCDISWSVWNYNTGEDGATDQALAAVRLYDQLSSAFCPSCSCPEISAACNSSLIEFSCTQTYRACGDNGLQTSVCEDSCADIQSNCGYTFEQVGLPMFSCNHNFYYSSSDEICTEIYDITVTDGSDALLWVVVILVLFCVVLILIAVIIAVVFKRAKKARMVAAYEAIDDESD